ncbi:MAG: triose-phosphate isomerase [Gammaproteobacteria bacterium]|nr:triose-phosphate isomerase [Gammaproteobacteria bacterium]
MRRPLVVANWKMNGSKQTNSQWLQEFAGLWQGQQNAEVAVCPPAVYLAQLQQALAGQAVLLGAQDVSAAESGAYTGEISAAMLSEFNCRYAIVGHSERRGYHAESNAQVAAKFVAAQAQGLVPLLCIGETLAQREAGETLAVVGEQLRAVAKLAGVEAMTRSVIAYEPVWAIGTGLTASPEQAQEVHAFIRQQLGAVAQDVRVLYGGSVKPGSAVELFAQQDIDGALVGGASLNSKDFYDICRAAQ